MTEQHDAFHDLITQGVSQFRTWDKEQPLRVISHLDADGICAASVMAVTLRRAGYRYNLSILSQLSDTALQELAQEPCQYFIFTDFGSGQFPLITQHLIGRNVLILDHHTPAGTTAHKFIHINPHLAGIEEDKEISGAGVVFMFARALDQKNSDLAHLAIIGALGDVQEDQGFQTINNEILTAAIEKKKIMVKKGLRLFGAQTRPLHKALEYSSDVHIPGVSGSESGAIQFLIDIGISPKRGNDWTKLIHLTEEEEKRLADAIIMRRLSEKKPEDIFGNNYLLIEEEPESPLKDAKEFATLLNACGRLKKPSLGIGACIGDRKMKLQAVYHLNDYRREIMNGLRWFEENRYTERILRGNGYVIISAQDRIASTMIGTLASMISKSGQLAAHTFILSLAWAEDNTTKASLRISGIKEDEGVDLKSVISLITERVGGEAGGHKMAAGAIIAREKEQEFIAAAQEILAEQAVEERIR